MAIIPEQLECRSYGALWRMHLFKLCILGQRTAVSITFSPLAWKGRFLEIVYLSYRITVEAHVLADYFLYRHVQSFCECLFRSPNFIEFHGVYSQSSINSIFWVSSSARQEVWLHNKNYYFKHVAFSLAPTLLCVLEGCVCMQRMAFNLWFEKICVLDNKMA